MATHGSKRVRQHQPEREKRVPDDPATAGRGETEHQRAKNLSAEVLKISIDAPEPETLRYAGDMIARGLVVGIPTDTFYGLAADPFNLAAVEQVYRIKGRQEHKALPILVGSIEQAVLLARDLPQGFLKLAKRFWPGALTIVVDASRRVPLKVTGGTGSVALRWPGSRVACGVVEAACGPVTGTSANLAGFPPCTSATQVIKQIGERVPLILDGSETGAILASTVVELRRDSKGEKWTILREGMVAVDAIKMTLES